MQFMDLTPSMVVKKGLKEKLYWMGLGAFVLIAFYILADFASYMQVGFSSHL
jgi:hypothetical protein